MEERITDKKLIYYIINHYIDMRKLLRKLHIEVRANNSMFCPFHDNTNTPAAHLYKEEDGSYTIYCYSEDKLFSNVDLYKNFLPDIDLEELANLLYKNLSSVEREKIFDNINHPYEPPELPFNNLLVEFKANRINFPTLLQGINMTMPHDDTIRLLNLIYSQGDTNTKLGNKNKYLYYMNKYTSDYKFISASKLLVNFSNSLPSYFINYLKTSGDSIMLPNKINDTVYTLTFRNIYGPKQFIKLGSNSFLFYGLGKLPQDFVYGIPIMLVEGNIDCDSAREIYPYTLATLTNAISLNQIQLLSFLTNKVIVAYDNDEAGNKGYWGVYNSLSKLGFKVMRFRHSERLKDFGDLLDYQMTNQEEYDYFKMIYQIQIENLINS